MSDLALDRLCVTLDGRTVVREASLTLARGELVALLGANGAGKTTLLRAALGLTARDGGTVSAGGRDPARLAPAERARAHHLPAAEPTRGLAVAGARHRGARALRPRRRARSAGNGGYGGGLAGAGGVRPAAVRGPPLHHAVRGRAGAHARGAGDGRRGVVPAGRRADGGPRPAAPAPGDAPRAGLRRRRPRRAGGDA